jgi:hypothetical protein
VDKANRENESVHSRPAYPEAMPRAADRRASRETENRAAPSGRKEFSQ